MKLLLKLRKSLKSVPLGLRPGRAPVGAIHGPADPADATVPNPPIPAIMGAWSRF